MGVIKTAQFSIRVKASIKDSIQLIAGKQNRSMSNMIECALLDYLKDKESDYPEIKSILSEN